MDGKTIRVGPSTFKWSQSWRETRKRLLRQIKKEKTWSCLVAGSREIYMRDVLPHAANPMSGRKLWFYRHLAGLNWANR